MMENLIEMVLDAKSFYVYLGIFMAVLDIIIHFHSRATSVLSNQKMGVPVCSRAIHCPTTNEL